jgi:crotonobetainyl-CoA:carnitine CoA-transferase CaiB-like acyl-CoA transferase
MKGVRVLEVSEMLFAPSSAAVLADWGAEVIKIEHPVRGDRARGIMATGVIPIGSVNYLWEQANRGKKSVAVDLNTSRGLGIVYRLAEQSDVFITNFLTSARRRIGIEYEDMAKVNPQLIYARMNGYGPRGAESERGGYDYAAFWARGGFSASLGAPDGGPTLQRPGLGDNTGGMFATGAIAAALFYREKTGEGALIDLSLLACATWVNSMDILAAYYSGQRIPRLSRKEMGNPLWNSYQTGDGRWLQLVMLQTDPYWTGFCRALERQDLEHDPRFATHQVRCENTRLLIDMLDDIFLTKTLAQWGKRLDEEGCLWTYVQETAEVAEDPQVLANEYLVPAGDLTLVASPPQFNSRPGQPRDRAPGCGQHTEEVLLAAGYSWDELVSLKEDKVII